MTHGYLSATVKGYARRRMDEWRRMKLARAPRATGQANIAGWKRLEELANQAGIPVQRGGDRLVEAAA